ncbi:unnamed protein product [Brachionus calyciflorus]|uniref:Uncharacterized protein n=1 Tax=Brachionus calyciflorus TaxID=104777 RepID=A0A813T7V8_9BILA|nr:unnamed protein product [Brachionus calyciflorus]
MLLGIDLLRECDSNLEDVLHIRCATHILKLVVEAGLEQDELKNQSFQFNYMEPTVNRSSLRSREEANARERVKATIDARTAVITKADIDAEVKLQ